MSDGLKCTCGAETSKTTHSSWCDSVAGFQLEERLAIRPGPPVIYGVRVYVDMKSAPLEVEFNEHVAIKLQPVLGRFLAIHFGRIDEDGWHFLGAMVP
jgi:hypothetical protein